MRLFIAIEIPEEIKAKLWSVAEKFDFNGVTVSKKENYHITMQFLGEIPQTKLQNVTDAMSAITENKFNINVSTLSSFENRMRVLFADIKEGSDELISIYSKLDKELRNQGVEYEKENEYRPHITLARVKFTEDKDALMSVFEKHWKTDFGSFVAESMLLKSSTSTPQGHVHQILYEQKLI